MCASRDTNKESCQEAATVGQSGADVGLFEKIPVMETGKGKYT